MKKGGNQRKVTVADIAPLIDEVRGNVAAIARRFGVSRATIWSRIRESPTPQQSLADARETMIDNAESVLYRKILDGDTPELLFFLKTQGKARGYVERQEITGKDGKPVEVVQATYEITFDD